MKRLSVLAVLWAVWGLCSGVMTGIAVGGSMAVGHLAVPIMVFMLPKVRASGSTFVPTAEQYRDACEAVNSLWLRQGYTLGSLFIVFVSAAILMLVSLIVLGAHLRKLEKAQPPAGADAAKPASAQP